MGTLKYCHFIHAQYVWRKATPFWEQVLSYTHVKSPQLLWQSHRDVLQKDDNGGIKKYEGKDRSQRQHHGTEPDTLKIQLKTPEPATVSINHNGFYGCYRNLLLAPEAAPLLSLSVCTLLLPPVSSLQNYSSRGKNKGKHHLLVLIR